MIKSFISLVLIISFCFSALGQIGVSTSYQTMNARNWKTLLSERDNPAQNLFDNQVKIGIDYWFRLKNQRIEFLPTISVATGSANNNYGENQFFRPDQLQQVGFHINSHFYIFDFMGDCDCPTWSKQGNFFTKGFFINLGPGITYHRITTNVGENQIFENPVSTSLKFDVSIGLGLDIGISNLITLSPYFNYRFMPAVNYADLQSLSATTEELITGDDLYPKEFGIRIGFRPDYGK